MIRLTSAILSRTGSPGTLRGKIASSRIFAVGKFRRSSSTTAPTPSAISGAVDCAGVVRADHQHHGLRLEALTLAVPQAPQHALRRVAGDREVGGPDAAEVLVEHRLVRVLHPPVGDRIAVQQQVDVALLGDLDEPFVPRAHALVGLRERRRDVEPRRLQQHQRLELLQQRLRRRLVAVDEPLQRGVDLCQFGRRRPRDRDLRRHRRRRPDHDRREAAAAWPASRLGGRLLVPVPRRHRDRWSTRSIRTNSRLFIALVPFRARAASALGTEDGLPVGIIRLARSPPKRGPGK